MGSSREVYNRLNVNARFTTFFWIESRTKKVISHTFNNRYIFQKQLILTHSILKLYEICVAKRLW